MTKNIYNRKEQLKFTEFLFFVVFYIVVSLKGFGVYDGHIAFKIFMPVVFLLILIKIIIEDCSMKEFICAVLILFFSSIVFFSTKNKGYLISAFMFLGMKKISIDKLFRRGMLFAIGSILANFFLYIVGIKIGDVRLHFKLGGEILRYSFGNSHPNSMHMTYVIMCILVLYSLKDDKKKLHIFNVILFTGSVFLCIYTVSFTGVMLSLLIFGGVCYFCITYGKNISGEKYITYIVVAGCVVFSSIIPILLKNNEVLFDKVNRFFHTRLSLLLSYYEAYDIKLLPQRINDYQLVSYQIDNSFAELLLESGLICSILFSIGLVLTIRRLLIEKDRLAVILILVQLIGGITDPYLFNASARNLIILWMGQCFYNWFSENDTSKKIQIPLFVKIGEYTLPTLNVRIGNQNHIVKKKKYIYISIIVSFLLASIVTLVMVINKTYPKAYGVSSNKFEGAYFERETEIHKAQYKEVAGDDSILIYNVSDLEEEVVYFDTPRICRIEKIRNALLIFINGFAFFLFLSYLIQQVWKKYCRISN